MASDELIGLNEHPGKKKQRDRCIAALHYVVAISAAQIQRDFSR
jgi:hypothetical protein